MQRSPTFGAIVALGVAVALTVGAARASAQPPPDGPPGGGPQGPVQILLAPAVQKELKLTEEQKNKVYSLSQTAGRRGREMFQRLLVGGPGAGGGNPQAMMGVFQQIRQENDRAIGQILDKPQSARFEQIVLQSEGPLAVARSEVAAQVGVNQAQTQAIQNVMQQMQINQREMFMTMRPQFGGSPPNPSALRNMGEKIRAEAVAQISKIIDRKQKAAFNKLLGEPFDLKALDADASVSAPPPEGSPPPGSGDKEKDEARGTTPPPPENEAPKAPSKTSKRKTRSRTPSKAASSPE